VKFQVLTHQNIDGTLRARKKFDAIAPGIAADLGGEDRLSTVQKHLVEGFASIAIHVNNLTAKLLRGEEVDVVEHSQAISTMVRVASRVGVERVAREVGPSFSEYLETIEDGAADEADGAGQCPDPPAAKNAPRIVGAALRAGASNERGDRWPSLMRQLPATWKRVKKSRRCYAASAVKMIGFSDNFEQHEVLLYFKHRKTLGTRTSYDVEVWQRDRFVALLLASIWKAPPGVNKPPIAPHGRPSALN
jgi:hypothetical protein